jgi:hypothetical protein
VFLENEQIEDGRVDIEVSISMDFDFWQLQDLVPPCFWRISSKLLSYKRK